jgi:hypothetical protein
VSPDGEVKATVNDTAKKVRKSVSKVFDNTVEVANGVLPESPSMYVRVNRSVSVLTCRRQVARRAEASVQNAQNALVPAETQRDLQVRAQKVSSALQKFTSERQVYIEKSIGTLQKVRPDISASADISSSPSQSTSSLALSPLSSCSSSETSYSSTTIPSSSLRLVVPRAISTRFSTPYLVGLQGQH